MIKSYSLKIIAAAFIFCSNGLAQIVSTSENFDSVTLPNLPSGWSSQSLSGSQNAITTNTLFSSAPNSALIPAPGSTSLTALNTKVFNFSTGLPNYRLTLQFNHKRGMELNWDGGVLEVSINGGAFVDVKNPSVGGTFTAGDYNIPNIIAGPLLGRPGWSGVSASFESVRLEIPSIPDNANVQFRFLVSTDNIIGSSGWYIDNISLTPTFDASVEVIPVKNEISVGGQALFDSTILNPTNFGVFGGTAYIVSPTAPIKSITFSDSGFSQKFGLGTFLINSLSPISPLDVLNQTVRVDDVPGRAGGRLTFTDTDNTIYIGAETSFAFLSSSPSIPGGALEAGFEFLAFDPCIAPPSPLPFPIAGKVLFSIGAISCTYTQAAIALQNLGVAAVIFNVPVPPSTPTGQYPLPYVEEPAVPGLSIPVLTLDIFGYVTITSAFSGVGTMSVRLEGVKTNELRTLPLSYLNSIIGDANPGNNLVTALVNVVTDSDNDGTPDIRDACKVDNKKTSPGVCGCGNVDADNNSNGVVDCLASADFKAQANALKSAVSKLKLTGSTIKALKNQIKALRAAVKSVGVNNASSISVSGGGVDIAKLTKAADKAVGAALKAKSDSALKKSKSAASKALSKLIKGIAA